MSKALLEAIKEPIRYLVLAVLSWLLTAGVVAQLVEQLGGSLDVQTRALIVAGLLAVLRGVDKYLHELGKEKSTARTQSNLVGGLTRF